MTLEGQEQKGGSQASTGGIRTIYTEPPTFMGMLLECTQFIEKVRQDPIIKKDDILDSLEMRLSLLVGKMAAQPTSSNFQINVVGGGQSLQATRPS